MPDVERPRPPRRRQNRRKGCSIEDVRVFARSLPEVEERDHHGMSSFRVRGKIFATVPDPTHLRAMVDEVEIRAAVAAHPIACSEFYWGKRLACVVIDLHEATAPLVEDLLMEAWAQKAPPRLVATYRSAVP